MQNVTSAAILRDDYVNASPYAKYVSRVWNCTSIVLQLNKFTVCNERAGTRRAPPRCQRVAETNMTHLLNISTFLCEASDVRALRDI